jgi:mono/diheme cytochrome c family protein
MVAKFGADAEAGRAVYEKSCKSCHGATGRGNPAMVKASKGAMQDLSSEEVQSRTDEQMAKDIAGGTGQKKPIKPLSEKQMKDVIAFVRAMAKK